MRGRLEIWKGGRSEFVLRTLFSGFLVVWLECRKLSITYEDILIAWVHRPAVEVVIEERLAPVGLGERIDEVYPF